MSRVNAGAVSRVQAPTDIDMTRQLLRRMLHTVDEVDQVIFANREKLKIDKGAQDFSRRIAKMSGVGDRNAAPDGTSSVPWTPGSRLLGNHRQSPLLSLPCTRVHWQCFLCCCLNNIWSMLLECLSVAEAAGY